MASDSRQNQQSSSKKRATSATDTYIQMGEDWKKKGDQSKY